MQLDQFVRDSLVQIMKATDDAKSMAAQFHASVIPQSGDRYATHNEPIHFDVAVTVGESTTSEGGGGIKVVGISVGGSVNGESTTQVVSRISFSIPIGFTKSV